MPKNKIESNSEDDKLLDIDEKIKDCFKNREGFVDYYRIKSGEAKTLIEKESSSLENTRIGKIYIENIGIQESLTREVNFAIAYFESFFKGINEVVLQPSVRIINDNEVIGEDINSRRILDDLIKKKKVLLIGTNFVIYKNKARKSGGKSRIVYPGKRFPLIEELPFTKDVISGSPSPSTDLYLKRIMGLNINDSRLGTVIIGFNLK